MQLYWQVLGRFIDSVGMAYFCEPPCKLISRVVGLRCGVGDLSESDEEELFAGEIDGRQSRFAAVLRRPVLVCVVGRLQPAAVRYVLAQCLPTPQLHMHAPF